MAVAGSHGAVDEYQLKAAFLYNFAKFVEWPPQSFRTPNDPIVICILGQNPFGETLQNAVDGKLIDGRPLVVRGLSDVREAAGCQIIFVSSSERKRLSWILENLDDNGVLTVGDTQGFAAEGGVVNFKLEGDRIRIEINLRAAIRKRLRISAKLLSMSEVVR